ncbi:hypothetical protein ACJMK2_006614 [Sinanodonta woodiana]|uniref:Uncharacterized protein n=1 Tax=Sinanodonta woodiana TaxID=1069815 RepID=A0ABD3VTN7_SINWO
MDLYIHQSYILICQTYHVVHRGIKSNQTIVLSSNWIDTIVCRNKFHKEIKCEHQPPKTQHRRHKTNNQQLKHHWLLRSQHFDKNNAYESILVADISQVNCLAGTRNRRHYNYVKTTNSNMASIKNARQFFFFHFIFVFKYIALNDFVCSYGKPVFTSGKTELSKLKTHIHDCSKLHIF